MKIVINGVPYQLTDEQHTQLTNLFRAKIEQEYDKLETSWRLAAKAASRGVLGWIEDRVKLSSGIEEAKKVRPGKGADPVPHLFGIGERILKDMLAHVTLSFETCTSGPGATTEEAGTIEGFTVIITGKDPGQDGGQMDSNGNIRVRENDGVKVS